MCMIIAICVHIAPAEMGPEGRNLKATGERWWLGHGVGRFESRADKITR
jgi:hypothetical protein